MAKHGATCCHSKCFTSLVTIEHVLQKSTEFFFNYMKALWNWQRNSKFNRASRAGKQKHRENIPTDTLLSVQEEDDVPTNHALMAQDRYVAQ